MDKIFSEATVAELGEARRLSDRVCEIVREAVVTRAIEPRQWLRQDELAEELNVSRTTVRSALTQLAAEGLLEEVPYQGFRAISISPEEAEEIGVLRAKLESWAFELAASEISEEELAKMRRLLPQTVLNPALSEQHNTRIANREFHWIAIRASRRQHLIRLLEHIWDLMPSDLVYSELPEEDRVKIAERERAMHVDLVDCLEAGDGHRAADIIERHVMRTVDYTVRVLSAREADD